jgi:hypothetical protein
MTRATLAKRQQALIDELHAIAKRLDELMLLENTFPKEDDYLNGQCNSCLIVAYHQLATVVSTVGDQYYDHLVPPNENLVLQVVERRGKPRGKRGMEANPKTAAGVGRSGMARGVVAGGSR